MDHIQSLVPFSWLVSELEKSCKRKATHQQGLSSHQQEQQQEQQQGKYLNSKKNLKRCVCKKENALSVLSLRQSYCLGSGCSTIQNMRNKQLCPEEIFSTRYVCAIRVYSIPILCLFILETVRGERIKIIYRFIKLFTNYFFFLLFLGKSSYSEVH